MKIYVPSFPSLLCMLCASSLLTGCSYFNTEDMDVSQSPPSKIDLMNGAAYGGDGSIAGVYSHGSVQVFSLDGPAEDTGDFQDNSDTSAPAWPGVRLNDPSVQVFPLDDAMRNSLAPQLLPSGVYRSSEAVMPLNHAPVPLIEPQYSSSKLFDEPQDYAQAQPKVLDPVVAAPLATVYFEHDSADLDSQDQDTIDGVSQVFVPGRALSVEGHASVRANYADEMQRHMVNLRISMDRALAVAKNLIEAGVPADAVHTVAWGDTRPSGPVGAMDGESASRRVEIIAQNLQ